MTKKNATKAAVRPEAKSAAKPAAKTARTATDRKAEIIRDLAEKIERQATEHFAAGVAEIREGLMRVLRNRYPNSSDATLEKLGVLILRKGNADETAIMAEVRELNSSLVESERPMKPCPIP